MKFRAKKANHYKDAQWAQGTVAEFSENDVKKAIAKGVHTTKDKRGKVTKKPMSALLNHWSPMDKEAKKAVAAFDHRHGRR